MNKLKNIKNKYFSDIMLRIKILMKTNDVLFNVFISK